MKGTPGNGQRGFTYIEMLVVAAILVVLASTAIPLLKWNEKRRKEARLRVHLTQMRDAIDLYKQFADDGRILLEDVEQMGYPPDLETLTEGVSLSAPVINTGQDDGGLGLDGERAEAETFRFLQRVPVDPITGEEGWGLRSYQDDWDSDSWGGENVYDVYSLSDKKALDGTYYRDW